MKSKKVNLEDYVVLKDVKNKKLVIRGRKTYEVNEEVMKKAGLVLQSDKVAIPFLCEKFGVEKPESIQPTTQKKSKKKEEVKPVEEQGAE